MFQDPTSSAITNGWRTNPTLPPPLPSEGALLVSGPAEVEIGALSVEFVVSLYGTLRGDTSVALSFGGVPVTPTETSVVLTTASPTATVQVTPSALGAATITATCAGLISGLASYTVVSALPVPNMSLWAYTADPEAAWGSTHATNADGVVVAPKINLEFDAAGSDAPTNPQLASPTGYKLNSAIGTYDGSDPSPSYKVAMTTTELRLGQSTPTFAIVKRIADPGGGGFTCFKHTHDRDEHYWADGNKWRSQFLQNGAAANIPWGTELWVAHALRFTSDMVLASPGGWFIALQLHQGSGSRIKGGALELLIDGGNGNPANARMRYEMKHYRNPNWLAGDYTNSNAYIKLLRNVTIVTPVVDTWYYIVIKMREGCGYSDPNYGAIYGTLGQYSGGVDAGNDYYARLWYAVGGGDPIEAAPEWRGHWGSPNNPTHSSAANNVLVDGVLTNKSNTVAVPGIYQYADLLPASQGTQRTLIHRGVRVWRHQDGMTQQNVLQAFRGF